MNSSHLPLEHVHNRIHCIGASDSDSPHGRSLQTAATPSRWAPKCGIMHLGTRTHTSVNPYIISHRPTQQDFRPVAGQTQSHSTASSPCHCERREAICSLTAKPRKIGFVSHARPQRELPPRPAGPRPFPDNRGRLASFRTIGWKRAGGRRLALFRRIGPHDSRPPAWSHRAPPGIGFVLHNRPLALAPQAPSRPAPPGIGFVLPRPLRVPSS